MTPTVTISVEEYDRLREDAKALKEEKQSKEHTITLRIYDPRLQDYLDSHKIVISENTSSPEIRDAMIELKEEFINEINTVFTFQTNYKDLYDDCVHRLSRIPKWIVKLFNR